MAVARWETEAVLLTLFCSVINYRSTLPSAMEIFVLMLNVRPFIFKLCHKKAFLNVNSVYFYLLKQQ